MASRMNKIAAIVRTGANEHHGVQCIVANGEATVGRTGELLEKRTDVAAVRRLDQLHATVEFANGDLWEVESQPASLRSKDCGCG